MDWRRLIGELRREILIGLGIAPSLVIAACGGAPVSAGDDGMVTTDPSGDGSSVGEVDGEGDVDGGTGTDPDPSGSSTGPDPGDTDAGDGDGDPPPLIFDIGGPPDAPPPGDCFVTSTPASTLDEHPECPIVFDDPLCYGLYWGCTDLEPGQTCEQQCVDGDCIMEWWNCSGDPVFEIPTEVCGPYEVDGQCCSIAEVFEYCGTDGRPFVVAGQARTAGLVATKARVHGCDEALPLRVRERLASHWAHAARAEHASIASFASFTMALLALGAPADLVRDALRAARDEVRHAELTLAWASALAGDTLAFDSLDTSEAPDRAEPADLEAAVLACVREGCIGETLAAVELRVAAAVCRDLQQRDRLLGIAADEARHAALAWRFVAWALARAPELGPKVAAQFDGLSVAAIPTEEYSSAELELLRARGWLPGDERRAVRQAAVDELLRPCATALLGRFGRSGPGRELEQARLG